MNGPGSMIAQRIRGSHPQHTTRASEPQPNMESIVFLSRLVGPEIPVEEGGESS